MYGLVFVSCLILYLGLFILLFLSLIRFKRAVKEKDLLSQLYVRLLIIIEIQFFCLLSLIFLLTMQSVRDDKKIYDYIDEIHEEILYTNHE